MSQIWECEHRHGVLCVQASLAAGFPRRIKSDPQNHMLPCACAKWAKLTVSLTLSFSLSLSPQIFQEFPITQVSGFCWGFFLPKPLCQESYPTDRLSY